MNADRGMHPEEQRCVVTADGGEPGEVEGSSFRLSGSRNSLSSDV